MIDPSKTEIRVADDLWASSMCPEGVLERWRVKDRAPVAAGQPVAELRIEDALHEVLAPAAGRLDQVVRKGQTVDPGTMIGELSRTVAPPGELTQLMATLDEALRAQVGGRTKLGKHRLRRIADLEGARSAVKRLLGSISA